ncbi:hypothetical protein N7494_000956 [Penicillium frequentans]|uniref:G domain-containing protein n=1 Tax=Penicillium frequentans TaxID=3151616 RepID=A0AAD6GKA4_9EURO|nr:hypothetical protein N7494_000956 [Penicillium glabrum]
MGSAQSTHKQAQAGDYEKEAKEGTEESLKQFRNGELAGKVKVILVLGPAGAGKTNLIKLLTEKNLKIGHDLESGTLHAECVYTEIEDQKFLFIDTPGFGDPNLTSGTVKKAIYTILGYFTRQLGGIHGILYVQSIVDSRFSSGMQESSDFLSEICDHNSQLNVTFITTKWDMIVEKEMQNCRDRELTLVNKRWKAFKVGEHNGARSWRSGASWDDDFELRTKETARLRQGILSYFQKNRVDTLVMPFSQWPLDQQILLAIECATGAFFVAVAGCMLAFGIAVGTTFTFTFSFIF